MPRGTRRPFAPQFKARVVLDALTGAPSQAEVCRRQGLKAEPVALRKKTFLGRLPLASAGDARDGREAARAAELGRTVGRLTLELEVATKASALLPSALGGGGRS